MPSNLCTVLFIAILVFRNVVASFTPTASILNPSTLRRDVNRITSRQTPRAIRSRCYYRTIDDDFFAAQEEGADEGIGTLDVDFTSTGDGELFDDVLSETQENAPDQMQVMQERIGISSFTNNDVLGIAFYSFLGFTLVQSSYAMSAKSSAMVADSAAMFVDAGTYLCNMLAERLKTRSITEDEALLPPPVLEHTLKLQRLYLELFPPLVSVMTLLYLTCTTFQQALISIASQENPADQPNLKIMMLFSFLNLLLDIVNVTGFARVRQAIRTPVSVYTNTEETPLLQTVATIARLETTLDDEESADSGEINLNMYSAWTHVFADTIRSIFVLFAGAIASVTDIISPAKADASAAIFVSFVIFLSCVPLIKGLLKTFHEITILSDSTLKRHM